jgi:ureidoacrylate peracid hydrolase
VIDMQNAYASLGGYVDLAGFDISGAAQTITRIAKVLDTARASGIQIVYLQNGWDPDYVEAGGPGSPNWHKSNALKAMRQRPELSGKLLARGTWDYDIVDALKPREGDIRVASPATAPFSIRSSTASCARAASARSSSSASPPMSASNPRCATGSTSNTLE